MGYKRGERAAVAGRAIARLRDPDFRRFLAATYGESPTFVPVLRTDSVGFLMKRLRESRPGAVIIVDSGETGFDLLTVEPADSMEDMDAVLVQPRSDMDMFLRYLATQPGRTQVFAVPCEEEEVRLELLDSAEFCSH